MNIIGAYLALIAMCRAVSPLLSQADTLAFFSNRSCTASMLRDRTARNKHVSPSYQNMLSMIFYFVEPNVQFKIKFKIQYGIII